MVCSTERIRKYRDGCPKSEHAISRYGADASVLSVKGELRRRCSTCDDCILDVVGKDTPLANSARTLQLYSAKFIDS